MTKVNVPLLETVMTFIRDNPDEWDQNVWIHPTALTDCGTVACFAGWTCLLSGYRALAPGQFYGSTCVAGKNGELEDIPNLAASLLGLEDEQVRNLFNSDNSFDDLERIVKDIVNEAKAGE